jgi:hypothetical protein
MGSIAMASERIRRQIERLLDEADQAVTKRDWPTVRECAHDILNLEPENREATIFLADREYALSQ